ncbi:conserved hypothetical protein [Tenacibaculum amylolyticum]
MPISPYKKPCMYYYILSICCFFTILKAPLYAQKQTKSSIVSKKQINSLFIENTSNSSTITLPDGKAISIAIQHRITTQNNLSLLGTITEEPHSSFQLYKNNTTIHGKILMYNTNKAYVFSENTNHQIIITEQPIDDIVCIGYPNSKYSNTAPRKKNIVIPDLQSYPSSNFVVYLDFDGEQVTDTSWDTEDGFIDAAASRFDAFEITEIWNIISEDFRPFDLNITTNRTVYNNTPPNQRMMCIFTPTDDANPGGGGIAYVNSFTWPKNGVKEEPCWVFHPNHVSAGESGSHEIGHTLGLSHDGTLTSEYYLGHGDWAPIMGVSYLGLVTQWSKGEYEDANNKEDDIAIMASQNGFGFRPDDHSNTTTSHATLLNTLQNMAVFPQHNTGIIETTSDVDVFKFATTGGQVRFNFTSSFYTNLNIEAKLLDVNGEELLSNNPNLDMYAALEADVTPGIYYLSVQGAGEGNLQDGYSDYNSVGYYEVSGVYNEDITAFKNITDGVFAYPNPAQQEISIGGLRNPSEVIQQIAIFNQTGQKVYENSEYTNAIPVADLTSGLYILLLNNEHSITFLKR